jgi:hypothetical protein
MELGYWSVTFFYIIQLSCQSGQNLVGLNYYCSVMRVYGHKFVIDCYF